MGTPGEGNGNPLQYSCLENPRDGGAWWAAVYGVTQSRTQLKWLSMHAWVPFLQAAEASAVGDRDMRMKGKTEMLTKELEGSNVLILCYCLPRILHKWEFCFLDSVRCMVIILNTNYNLEYASWRLWGWDMTTKTMYVCWLGGGVWGAVHRIIKGESSWSSHFIQC